VFPALLILAGVITHASPHDGGERTSPEDEYQKLVRRYEAAYEVFVKASREARTKADEEAVLAHPGRNPRGFAGGFMSPPPIQLTTVGG